MAELTRRRLLAAAAGGVGLIVLTNDDDLAGAPALGDDDPDGWGDGSYAAGGYAA